jgi:DNA modification methylase
MNIELWPIERLKPYPGNPRNNDAAVNAVVASLREFGFRQPIVVDKDDVIVVGHTRYRAAQKLGLKMVPVHLATDLSDAQVRAYRLADNATNELANWNLEMLPIELSALQEVGYDLNLLGFDPAALARYMGDQATDGLTDPNEVPPVPEKAITQPGDLWLLGEHRLLCGDSTNPSHIAKLMHGESATMMFTDPPWNVAIGLDSNPRHRQRRGLKNDSLPPEQFQKFLDGFISAVGDHVTGDIYCVLGASEWPRLDATLRAHDYHWSATIIWVKDVFVLGRSQYHRRYEPLWYGWKNKGKSSFNGKRDLDDVWEIPRPKRSEEHPTMKPVELPLRAIQNSSLSNQIVLDPFGGAGSTLIAAEQTGRRAYLMEIDPLYCDVIVQRWESFSGKKAKRGTNTQERTPTQGAGVRKGRAVA